MRRRIFIRELLLLAMLIAVTCLAMAVSEVALNRHQRRQHCREKTLFLAQQLDKLLHWDDRIACRELLQHTLATDPLVRYAFVERSASPYVHTFPTGVPSGLLGRYPADAATGMERILTDGDGRVFCDIAARVGATDAVVHLGLDRPRVDRTAFWPVAWITAIGTAFFLLVIYPARRVAGTITREIEAVTSRLRETNEQLESRVEERTLQLQQANQALVVEVDKRRQAQEQVQQLNAGLEERVRQRTDQLETALRNLERSNQELEQFAYVASHDLQEPLRKISAFGERLNTVCADLLPDQGRDYLGRILNAVRRMQSLISDLLSLSRVSTRASPFVPVNLNQSVQEVLSDLETRIQTAGTQIEVDPLPTIDADPVQMHQLFQNLIGNALKFRKESEPPLIKIRLLSPGNQARPDVPTALCEIAVEDNGIGFDEKYADRIFGIFQRLHSQRSYDGTGIGLAVCRKIAERHGGRIVAHSHPGEGSTFAVQLPFRQMQTDSAAVS